MNYVEFRYSNNAYLRNGESVKVDALLCVYTDHDSKWELSARADSEVNDWALKLGSADDALLDEAKRSLTDILKAIKSPRFQIADVIIYKLDPSSRQPKRKSTNVPSPLERAMNEMNERADSLEGLNDWWDKFQKKHPDLCASDDGRRLKNALEHLKSQFVGDVPRGPRKPLWDREKS